MSMEYFDRSGRPLASIEAWCELSDDLDYKIVGRDRIGPLLVSTVWLGLDHSWGTGPPVIFETMIFARPSWSDVYTARYCTEDEAIEGHAFAVLMASTHGRWRHGVVKHQRDMRRHDRKLALRNLDMPFARLLLR